MPELKIYQTGKLACNIYTFAKVGDELPMHAHKDGDNHITIIRRGRFKVFGDGWSQEHGDGAFLDWKVGQQHGFIALTDGAALINILKNA